MNTTTRLRNDTIANDLFKIAGLKIGQAENTIACTGCTVFLFEKGATVGVDIRGAAPGTRETALLTPGNLVEKVHAIVLAGGSAFGLAAMSGVTDYLEAQGIGYETGTAKVPIVCGAVLFDLAIGDAKVRPDYSMGITAAQAANAQHFEEGNHGAGMGATVGKLKGMEYAMKGGIGTSTLSFENGLIVSAVVAVNALGDVYAQEEIIAGMLNDDKTSPQSSVEYILNGYQNRVFKSSNTTLGVVITNAKLTKAQAQKLAQTTHNAYSECIRPTHTLYDGDTIFAAATGEIEHQDQLLLSVAATQAMEQAIIRAVKAAQPIVGFKAWQDFNVSS